MNPLIVEEIKENHNLAQSYIYVVLLVFDTIIFIMNLIFFGIELKNFYSLRQKLFNILMLDIIQRTINIFTDAYLNSLLQETVFNLIATIQFYFYLQILERIFAEFFEKYLYSILFFCETFDIKVIISENKLFCTIQYIFIILFIYIFYVKIMDCLEIFLNNIFKINIYYQGGLFLLKIPFFILIYLIIHYLFGLISLLIENELYQSYIIMICLVFREVSKYLTILHLIMILYAYNEYIKKSAGEFSIEQNKKFKKVGGKKLEFKDEEKIDIKQEEK